MKTAMLILGLLGSLIALGGSLVTMVGGVGGTAAGLMGENNGIANSGTFVFWSGVVAVVVSVLALVFSVVGGVAKKKNTILTFALATLVTGLLNIYLYNWFSGFLVTISGVLGLIGAKDGTDDQRPIGRSPLLYGLLLCLTVLAGTSALVKNGRSVIEASPEKIASSANPPPVEASALMSSPTASDLPFVGRRTFDFDGGNGTERAITLTANGHARIERNGSSGTSVDFDGAFANPLRIEDGRWLPFKGKSVFLTDGKDVQKGCKDSRLDCADELFDIAGIAAILAHPTSCSPDPRLNPISP